MKTKFTIITIILSLIILLLKYGKIEIVDKSGKFVDSSFFKNYYNSSNLILINVWSTTCMPCIAEFPELEKIKSEKFFNFVSLSTDKNLKKLNKFLNKHKVVKSRDITEENFSVIDSIFEIIELTGSHNQMLGVSLDTKIIPYTVLIKNKKILYKANDELDIDSLQLIINQNKN